MDKIVVSLILLLVVGGCKQHPAPAPVVPASGDAAKSAPIDGPFSSQELQQFVALKPIDAHTHVYAESPAFYGMLKKLNLLLVDILVDDDTYPDMNLPKETAAAWKAIDGSDGHMVMCTTFDPYTFERKDFVQQSIRKIESDFARGAVAVKLYKNVGLEIKDGKGRYLMPDNPVFEPVYKDIAKHNKTLIAHVADPDYAWQPPDPKAIDYGYYHTHPQEYMYLRKNPPSKPKILEARDRVLEQNPKLRMVGAHLGSMESNFHELAEHLDRYPNFAVDLAARMPYLELQPRAEMIAFITRYQDRLIYGTDHEFFPGEASPNLARGWEISYAREWRYLATNDVQMGYGHKIQGLALPESILRKIYHDNAVRWFPGIIEASRQSEGTK